MQTVRGRPLRIGSIRDTILAGLAVLAIGGAAYIVFQSGLYTPNIVQRAHTDYTSKTGQHLSAATRQIVIGGRTFWQIELQPGEWKDCGSDCTRLLRKEANE